MTGSATGRRTGQAMMGEVARDPADDCAGDAASLGLRHRNRTEKRERRYGDDDLAHVMQSL